MTVFAWLEQRLPGPPDRDWEAARLTADLEPDLGIGH